MFGIDAMSRAFSPLFVLLKNPGAMPQAGIICAFGASNPVVSPAEQVVIAIYIKPDFPHPEKAFAIDDWEQLFQAKESRS